MKIDKTFRVEPFDTGQRIDTYLARNLMGELSRSQLKKYFASGVIKINDVRCKPHTVVKGGDEIEVNLVTEGGMHLEAEEIPLEILFEDKDLIVINKPVGMVVHPAPGNKEHTLVNALLFHLGGELSKTRDALRPGIVHRLDKDTSGILVVAKNEMAHASLAKQIKNRTAKRIYWAFVKGVVQHDQGECREPIGRAFVNRKKIIVKPTGGKTAHTMFRVLARYKSATLLEVSLGTGRTHQIRVHMAHLGHPVLGDVFYGVKNPFINRQALHAKRLTIQHPRTGKTLTFESDLPEDMKVLIRQLEIS
ncbi:MAG: RluA family pseudouridine synthase [Candidatus Omnitrophica bacterium]|nr:RluA family pseudouridine synthase [Candidatus Omnitrophota bacterium]